MHSSPLLRRWAAQASPAPATRTPSLVLLFALLFALVFVGLAAPPASAQAPKSGDWYEDTSDVGFKVRVPKGWAYIPPTPDDGNGIGKYDAGGRGYINIPGGRTLDLNCWLLKFDRRPAPEGAKEKQEERPRFRVKDLATWVERSYDGFVWRQDSTKDTVYDGVDAVETVWQARDSQGTEIALYTMLYRVGPDLEVAFVGNGPGGKKWSKYESAWKQMARTFKRLEVHRVELDALGSGSLRAQKRVALQNQVASQPGWELYETPNYFLVSNVDDKEFLQELMDRLEAIRAVYEQDYPAARAEEIRQLALAEAAKRRAEKEAERKAKKEAGLEGGDDEGADGDNEGSGGDDESGGGDDEGEEEGDSEDEAAPEEGRSVARSADPMERSRTSVVRVCSTRDQYHSYGGPGGSAGYWNPADEELVIYDDQQNGGRRNTWATLNHEAFHQYIFYFYGSLAPHYWYNEGTGDYYSGFQLKNNRFQLRPFDWRVPTIKDAIREGTYTPLKDFVRYLRKQYYGENIGVNYAQGWSFVYFLRTGKKQAKHWNPRWDTILDLYLETLASSKNLDKAVDTAFDGVDFDELEAAWLEYTK